MIPETGSECSSFFQLVIADHAHGFAEKKYRQQSDLIIFCAMTCFNNSGFKDFMILMDEDSASSLPALQEPKKTMNLLKPQTSAVLLLLMIRYSSCFSDCHLFPYLTCIVPLHAMQRKTPSLFQESVSAVSRFVCFSSFWKMK